jgi:hypothetical protein
VASAVPGSRQKDSANGPRLTGNLWLGPEDFVISTARKLAHSTGGPLECGSLLPPWFGEACFAIPARDAGTATGLMTRATAQFSHNFSLPGLLPALQALNCSRSRLLNRGGLKWLASRVS